MSRRPNILLINCDDLGYGDLGCYGSTVNQTPAVDRLAADGKRFTDFYMASSVCTPSRGAMLTGCYPRRIGFTEFDRAGVLFPGDSCGLHPDEITIGTLLNDAGYATALIGKWHCGDQPEFLPTRHGFDHYYGLPYSNDMARRHANPDGYVPLPLMRGEEVIQQQPDQTSLTERYVEESITFMREHRDEPFFLYFAHLHVHLPLLVSERFLKTSQNGPYGAAVECIDWATASLRAELESLGLLDNTIIIFTSDNGSRVSGEGGSNAPLRGTKAQNYEGGIRVPCIVRWPDHVPAGTTCSALTTAMDFLPTLAAAANTKPPEDRVIDGHDATPLWTAPGDDADSPYEAFFYYRRDEIHAVRKGSWKLHLRIHEGGGRCTDCQELYDLSRDIGETENLFESRPDKVEELMNAFRQGAKTIGDSRNGEPGQDIRPLGRVNNPKPLTVYDPEHPYIIALYDGKAG
ncbi:sulfatase family protein [Puniceicoccus vermicola]|uniref:Sulfatase n=1 Tax=Puniceicoccus vermicola TaxID=388746 RepID=A0A7X1B0I1_9BACT|nr:sulfatase [Puniceicoccus vermicola]MBC2603219.1 sulfatase [Puniceicoccus vermicola]